ncbi:MAG: HAD family hydrolase [Planctomycetales bacterium]|nr:HAD family hydrolase [Planctomycetales bacterium]
MSEIDLPRNGVIVFDLDDTLIAERQFVASGFRAIARHLGRPELAERLWECYAGGDRDALGTVMRASGLACDKSELLAVYREHTPQLELAPGVRDLLQQLADRGHPLGLITDGRSVTQRNKLRALGLESRFDCIVISAEFGSEKPDERNFRHVMETLPAERYTYVGDNLHKDFIAPNRLGWLTICLLDQGENIHTQDFSAARPEQLPHLRIARIAVSS